MAADRTTTSEPGPTMAADRDESSLDTDVVVVGAGMAGLYLLYRLRGSGLRAVGLEAADDVGGTWYWNRYPGARCDIESIDYSYSFDRQLEIEWEWSEKYATQPEILSYLQHVAERYDLRRHIRFGTSVEAAVWDDGARAWTVTTDDGERLRCRYYIMATGCLSMPKAIDIEGADRFTGEIHITSRWPHEGVDFTGKRVAVIGTGSSGIQCIPLIAEQAESLTVFQRTPNFSVPAHNGPVSEAKRAAFDADPDAYREAARWSQLGAPAEEAIESALAVPDGERTRRYEAGWRSGSLIGMFGAFNDLVANTEANDTLAEFVRNKIRTIVDDPDTARILCPDSYPILTKRLCLDTDYYATFNRPHVSLVDLRVEPIASVTETGIDTVSRSHAFDVIVYATGFDAMTGALVAVDITGRDGVTLAQRWADGPATYLGLMSVGFPNLFMITGPQSPSVLSNMAVSIEQHVEWVTDAIAALRTAGHDTIEPTPVAEAGWVQHNNDYGDITLFPLADSWYMGANVAGKPRVFLPYVGGVGRYRAICDEVVANDYLGFTRTGPDGSVTNDGVIRRVRPDVNLMLELLAELGVPPIETLPVEAARDLLEALNAGRPPGPEVGEMVDGSLPGADGDELEYRLYRPPTEGPHAIIVYFHGGGWVLGHQTSDEPFCRDLCVRTNAVVISVDYRHAPEHRFPAAVDDAMAAVTWVADRAEDLGGAPGHLAVAGWSAGANLAAVVARQARDAGGPALSGQLLLTPATDCDAGTGSYSDNADGYFLTRPLMEWFWNHYVPDPEQRTDARVAPLRADDLSALPPAVVVTAEFDPLRDEGAAYAAALAEAGVAVEHIPCRGQIHNSLTAVDQLPSGAEHRAQLATAVRAFFPASVMA